MADEYYAIHITEKSEEVLNAFLDKFTEEQKGGIIDALQWQLENMGLKNQRIVLEEFDYGTLLTYIDTPEKPIELGSINLQPDGTFKESHEGVSREDIERELENSAFIAEQFKTEIEENIAELDPEMSSNSDLSNAIDIKELLHDAGLSEKAYNREFRRTEKEVQKEEQNRLKNSMNELKEQVLKLSAEVAREDAIAELNGGFTPEQRKERDEIAQLLANKTNEYIKAKQNFSKGKTDFIGKIRESKERVAGLVGRTLGKLERGYDALINNGINGLTKMRDTVRDANEKFKVQGETAYTSLRVDLMEIDKMIFATDYAINKSLAEATEHLVDGLNKTQNYSQNIGTALKNLGRALVGKEALQPERAEPDKGIARYFKSLANSFRERADESHRFYNDTRKEQIEMLEEINDKREEVGLNMHSSVNDRIQDAIRRSAENDSIIPVHREQSKDISKDDGDIRQR